MTRLRRLFTDHPATVGETYTQHFFSALGFSVQMLIGAICCLVHAVLPFLFQTTGSGRIERLYAAMITNRHRAASSGRSQNTDRRADEPQRA